MNFMNRGPQVTGHEEEPTWIRDNQAATIAFDEKLNARPNAEWIADICEGESTYCENCGEKFPMWPAKGWANHIVTAHVDSLTIQARTGVSRLCEDEFNEAHAGFFGMMFASRVSMRRRAWKLGYALVAKLETVPPKSGRVKLFN